MTSFHNAISDFQILFLWIVNKEKIERIVTEIMKKYFLLGIKVKKYARIKENPKNGKYTRCSNITWGMQIKLDSTDIVTKNHKIPNDKILCFLKLLMLAIKTERMSNNENNVVIGLSKFFDIIKS